MARSKGTSSQGRLTALMAVARAPVVPPAPVVGGWVPGEPLPPAASPHAPEPDGDTGASTAPTVRRRVSAAAAVAALGLAVVVALLAWVRTGSAGQVLDVPPRPAGSPTSARSGAPAGMLPPGAGPTGPPSATAAAIVVVDVEGRVRRPGLVRLPAGSRVADAVRAAGGTGPGAVLTRLNLARVLVDGEQVLVPGPGDPVPAAAPGAAGGGSTPGSPLDLNAGTVESFDTLPGVGPVLAARIVAWRTEHGRFTSVDELSEVPGIGPKALERLRPLVRV